MPRRTRRNEPPARRRGGQAPPAVPDEKELASRIFGPANLAAPGYEAWQTAGTKRYRCPYCQGWIEPGTPHVVAYAAGRPEERRHYHSGCWVKHTAAGRH